MSNLIEFALKLKNFASPELKKFGLDAKKTFTSANTLTSQLSEKNQVLGNSYNSLTSKIRGSRQELERFNADAKRTSSSAGGGMGVGGALLGGLVATAGMAIAYKSVQYVKSSFAKMDIQQKADAQLRAVLKSTNGASGRNFAQLKTQASSLQKTTLFGDEETQKGQAMMLTFKNVKGAIYDQAIPAIQDMSTAFGQDLKSSAIQLGKALNDPIQGITALQRIGIQFSESQKKVVKSLVETGQTAKAQAIIMKEVNSEVGGSAVAAANTPMGRMKQLSNRMGDVQEKLGMAMMPMMTAFANIADRIMPRIAASIQPIAASIQNVLNYIHQVKSSTGGWMDYISILRRYLEGSILPVFTKIWNTATHIVGALANFVQHSELLKDILSLVYKFAGFIWTAIGGIVDALKWMFDNVMMPLLNAIEKGYRMIKGTKDDPYKNEGKSISSTVLTVYTPPKKQNQELLSRIAKNTQDNADAAKSNQSTIAGGGQKTVIINLGKFVDNINISTATMTETVAEAEQRFLEMFSRVLVAGAK